MVSMTISRSKATMHIQTRPPLFWGYTRFSTPPQQWGDSDRRQDADAREQAAAEGMPYVDKYRDLGISAYHSKNRTNGALGRFLEDLRSPPTDDPWPMPGDVLWFENFDRMSRAKPRSSLKLFMEIVESGAILMVRNQKFTLDILDEEDWRWQQVLSELTRAHKESKWKSERLLKTYEGNRERARRHQRAMVGNRCAAWLRPIADPKPGQWPLYEFLPAEEPKDGEPQKPRRADQYREAWEMIDAGAGSPTIADHFNTTGVPVLAHRIHGKPTQGWTAQLVRQLLRNPAAMGVYRQKKLIDGRRVAEDDCEDVPGYYPALVPADLFHRVDAAIKSRAGKAGKGPHGQHYANLFKGLCACEHNPDHSVTIGYRSKEGLRYLRCDQSRHKNCANKASFQYERFERLVLDLSGVGMQEMFANLLPKPNADPRHRRLAELEAIVKSGEEQMQVVWNRWLNPNAEATGSMRKRAEQQLERIDAEIAAHKDELTTLSRELRVIAAHQDDEFHDRVREARRQLETAEGDDRYAIRLRLAQELRRRIERIVLNDDRTATVRIREHQGLNKVDVHLTADGLDGIDILATDGTVLTRFDGAGLAMLDPIEPEAIEAA